MYILSQNWDVEVVGTTIRIRSALRNIHLQLRTEARKAIFIERLNMVYKGVQIICTKNEETSVIMPNGEFLKTTSGTIKNCEVGIDITQNGIQVGDNCEDARFEELKISSKQDFGMNIQYKIV